MLKITSDIDDQYREAIRKYRESNDCPLREVFHPGQEIWLRINITDPLAAEQSIMPLLHPKEQKTIEGVEYLGFDLQSVVYGGIGMMQEIQSALHSFIDNELESRVRKETVKNNIGTPREKDHYSFIDPAEEARRQFIVGKLYSGQRLSKDEADWFQSFCQKIQEVESL